MILECPSCHARYMVPIGLFALGGRQVRCARCKRQWMATLPNNVDVFASAPASPPSPTPHSLPPGVVERGGAALHAAMDVASDLAATVSHNLPAVITDGTLKRKIAKFAGFGLLALVLVAWPIWDRDPIVKVFPSLRGFYEALGLYIQHSGKGLVFNEVKSEIKYDSGVMRLYVDGVIHNTTTEAQLIPDIKARALGPDQRIIQSWWVSAPAANVAAESDVPFHTEIAISMQRTIADVYLEFYAQDEKGDVNQ